MLSRHLNHRSYVAVLACTPRSPIFSSCVSAYWNYCPLDIAAIVHCRSVNNTYVQKALINSLSNWEDLLEPEAYKASDRAAKVTFYGKPGRLLLKRECIIPHY
jgi:hypothetical protein